MAYFPFDPKNWSPLIEEILVSTCSPSQLSAITSLIKTFAPTHEFDNIHRVLLSETSEPTSNPKRRFRAVCALVIWGARAEDWGPHSGMLANVLVDESATWVDDWIGVLKAIGLEISPTFLRILGNPSRSDDAFVLARAYFEFCNRRNRLADFARLIAQSSDVQFDAVLAICEEKAVEVAFGLELRKQLANPISRLASVRLKLALFRMGEPGDFEENLSKTNENQATRAFSIVIANPDRVRLHNIRKLYEEKSVAVSSDKILRRSVLLIMAEHSFSTYDSELNHWLNRVARFHLLNDKDACCFSASELILRRLGEPNDELRKLRLFRREVGENGILGNIMINSRLQVFSILEVKSQTRGLGRIAISTTEVTNLDWHSSGEELNEDIRNPDFPFNITGLSSVFGYLNRLTVEDGLHSRDKCYPEKTNNRDYVSFRAKSDCRGYRLPTAKEWNIANESNCIFDSFVDEADYMSEKFAWTIENSNGEIHRVAMKLPNSNGLFDTFGNLYEICEKRDEESSSFVEKGLSIRANSNVLSLENEYVYDVNRPARTLRGFRIVRRID